MNRDMVMGWKFLLDIFNMGLDFTAGLVLPILFFQGLGNLFNPSLAVLVGALGGMLPDALHFAYMKLRSEPFFSIEKFHGWIHSKTYLDKQHLIGIGSQIALILAVVLVSKALLF